MAYAIWSYIRRLSEVFPQRLNRRHWMVFFVAVVAAGWFLSAHVIGAQGAGGGTSWTQGILNGMIQFLAWLMLVLANMAIGLTVFFLRFFVAIASYNDYINVAVVQLGWTMVRDVANMFFVVALLIIAFGTILGLEEYEWKKNLVKLIFAAIFINFSNLICQVIIDIAHVFTITFLNAVSATAGGNLINMFKLSEITSMVGANDATWAQGGYFIEILGGAIAAVIFSFIAAAAMGSYAFVMMTRVVSLWALIILSPLAYILGVLPSTKSYADKWWSEFGKHVIVAPIMVFFLWLSFATLGTGNVISSIQENIPERDQINSKTQQEFGYTVNGAQKGGAELQNNRLSLSKVTTWENMANFLIAIFFMYAGIKATQETGVAGSEMIGDAVAFGKKVSTYATGEALGRWVAGKGREHGGSAIAGAIDAVPLLNMLGPRGFMRGVNSLKAIGAKSVEGAAEVRNRWAKNVEESAADSNSSIYKFGAHLLARLGETAGRKEKRVEDWKKQAELQKEITEETYSTSSSRAGEGKLELGVRLHQVEKFNKAKKDKKEAQMEKKLLETEHNGIFGKREQEMFEARAAAEQINFDISEMGERGIAAERDKYLIKNNRAAEAVNLKNAEAKQAKARLERHGVIDYTLSRERTKEALDKIAAATDPEERDALRASYSEMALSQLAAHLGMEGGNRNDAFEKLGITAFQTSSMASTDDNHRKNQAEALSRVLGRRVGSSQLDLNDALAEFERIHGQNANGMLDQFRKGLEKSASEGAVSYAGLLRADASGKIRLTNFATDQEYIRGRRANAANNAKVTDMGKDAGLGASVDRKQIVDAAGKVQSVAVANSREAIDTLASMLSSTTSNNLGKINDWIKGDLTSIFRHSSDIGSVLKSVEGKMGDKKAFKSIMEGVINDIQEKIKSGSLSPAESVDSIRQARTIQAFLTTVP